MTAADQHASLSVIRPPLHAPRYRRWRVWYDTGHYEHGIIYRATKWRAESPSGELLEHPDPPPGERPVDGHAWIIEQIDQRENTRAAQEPK